MGRYISQKLFDVIRNGADARSGWDAADMTV